MVSVHLALGRQLNWPTGPPPRSEIPTGRVTPGTPPNGRPARMAEGPCSTMWGARKSDGGLIAVMCCLVCLSTRRL